MGKKLKPVYLKWTDAIGRFESWSSMEDALEWGENDYWHVETVGWILEENKEYLLICSKIGSASSEEPSYGQLFKIPKTWILKRKALKT